MKQIYDKTVKELIIDFANTFIASENQDPFGLRNSLKEGGSFTRDEVVSWFQKNYPKIKKGTINAHLALLSTNSPSRIHYSVHDDGQDDIFFQISPYGFRLYIAGEDPKPIYIKNETDDY